MVGEVTCQEVVKVLKAAKKVIQAQGWCQRAYCNEDGEHCASGAFIGLDDCYPGAKRFAYRLLAAVAEGSLSLPPWNDAPERTKADVLKAFDAAIELAEI